MATFQKGILGGFSGKVGTVVGASWRGLDILRSLPKRSSREATTNQLMQRARFTLTARFLRPVRPVLRAYFGQSVGERSRLNLATAYHITEAVTGDYPDFTIDYEKVVLTKGELLGLENPEVSAAANARLQVGWTDNSGQGQALTTDVLVLMVYNERDRDWQYVLQGGARTLGSQVITLPESWTGDTVHCWVSVASQDGKRCANSQYFGPLVVL